MNRLHCVLCSNVLRCVFASLVSCMFLDHYFSPLQSSFLYHPSLKLTSDELEMALFNCGWNLNQRCDGVGKKELDLLLTRCLIAYSKAGGERFFRLAWPCIPSVICKHAFSCKRCSPKDDREIIIMFLTIKAHNASLIYCRLKPKP